jgi:hypothetical protein
MAGTKTWATNDVVTAADLNGFVRDQWITICTSGTRPTTSQEGRTIHETDTDRYYRWDGAAWQLFAALGAWDSWSPVVTQGATPASTVSNGFSIKEGRKARGTANVAFTGAGTAATRVGFTLPYAADATQAIVGAFYFLDAGGLIYGGPILATSSAALLLVTGSNEFFGVSPAITIANGDNLIVDLSYRSAS